MSRDYCSSSSEHRGACTSQRASPVRTCIAVRMRVWAAVFARGCGVLRIVLLDNKADGRDATGEPAGRAERAHRPRARAPGSRILRQVQALLPCPGVAPRLHHSCSGRLHACSTSKTSAMSGAAHVALLLAVAGAGAGAFQVPAITLTRGCAPALSAPPRAASAVALQAPCRGSSLRLRAQGGGGEEASHGRYCLHVRLQVRAERRDEFLECIQANQRGTLTTEPLALAYLFGEDETSTNTFHFFEAYKGRAGFEAHTQTPHFADWEKFVATDPLSAPPQVSLPVHIHACVHTQTHTHTDTHIHTRTHTHAHTHTRAPALTR